MEIKNWNKTNMRNKMQEESVTEVKEMLSNDQEGSN